ncbi:2-polyprenyl-6-methoxyphenol hydroxylase-like FAD-dependent oxidoreductase [Haloactinospora alba]|uniref:2-polyprenyl-6-methoxyphenol hydroxylase-like FAD-dependent oxidoreductase n=1 Tax=Haloactinospora alba TaxID=405555 RepID=A0A543N8Y9_9ACTN|nr:styrene monooxygenase/indole monooxygenase family protein [Haloactinospora alba]TQN28294.1 2-polyprenyl-6-methoxyphenol hydroxylase-like FAD-dependent oxidoreductase [Haloactinospora alba]
MPDIGIIGSGIAGLHLGLFLRQHDIPVTIYSDRTPEDIGASRLPNSVAHHRSTLERERALGVEHWDPQEYGYFANHHHVNGPTPLEFRGDLRGPARALDYRIYLPRLIADFQERGGTFDIRAVKPETIVSLSEQHDLIVVAAGKGEIAGMFPRRADRSPYETPQRRLCVGLYHGVSYPDPKGMSLSVSPGHGELLELPLHSFEGPVTALLFEGIPGGDLEQVSGMDQASDPTGFEKTVLEKLESHFPQVRERADAARFHLTRPEDLLQGGLTPVVREDYTRLPNGRFALALGDMHTVLDPLVGQGANSASYSAWVTGETILEELTLDERFCQKVARRRADRTLSAAAFSNFMLRREAAPHLIELFSAMDGDPELAEEFVDHFNRPERIWDILSTPQRTRAYLAGQEWRQ